jgi:hypothetical protein
VSYRTTLSSNGAFQSFHIDGFIARSPVNKVVGELVGLVMRFLALGAIANLFFMVIVLALRRMV